MWARINNGVVAEITDKDPAGRFHPSVEWIGCSADVKPGWSYNGEALTPPPETPLAELTAQATHRVNTGYTAALATILNQYPDAETLSFDKQEREARTWTEWQTIGGTEPATPYIDAMLVERPIGKAELVSRIIIKADLFTDAHGKATGKRQRLEHDIKVAAGAEDRATLEAIDW